MKILFISSQTLFRDTRFGGAKRLYYLAKELERQSDLYLLCLDGGLEGNSGSPSIQEFSNAIFLPFTPLNFTWRKARFLPGIREEIARQRASIEAFLKDKHFDATLLAYPFSLPFLNKESRHRMGKVVYLEDDLLLENFRRDFLQKKTGLQKCIKFFRNRQGHAFYKKKLRLVDVFVCISQQEEKIVQSLFPHIPTRVLKYGIPIEEFSFLPEPASKNVLGFIGNFNHKPNLDALKWLVQDLFPFILKNEPDARLVLAGKNIPADFKKDPAVAAAIETFENIDRLEHFYERIGIFINPLRQGRGLRTKVVEAAAFGRPIISTALGAEGLEKFDMEICESPQEFLEAFLKVSRSKTYGETTLKNRRTVQEEFSLAQAGEQLLNILGP